MPAHPFFGCARSRMMGPDYSAVDDQVLHVSVMDEMLMHSFPYSAIAPSGESFVDAVPVTILGREQPPWGPGPAHPDDSLDESLTISFLSDVQAGLAAKELQYL